MSAGRTNAVSGGGAEMVQGTLSYEQISWPKVYYIDDSGWKMGNGTSVTSITPLKGSFVLFCSQNSGGRITNLNMSGGAEKVAGLGTGYFLLYVTGNFSVTAYGGA